MAQFPIKEAEIAALAGTMAGQVSGSTVSWSVRGEVPATETIPTTELCGAPDGGASGSGDAGCAWRVRAGAP